MAYNEEKLARLKHLKQLAQKAKAESDAVATRVKALEDAGAQANVLETIKVNGVVQNIEDKAVDIRPHSPGAAGNRNSPHRQREAAGAERAGYLQHEGSCFSADHG